MISTNLQVFHDVISKISRKTGEKLKKNWWEQCIEVTWSISQPYYQYLFLWVTCCSSLMIEELRLGFKPIRLKLTNNLLNSFWFASNSAKCSVVKGQCAHWKYFPPLSIYITDCLIPLQRDWCDLIGLIECWLKCYWQQLQVLEHKAQDTL